MRAIAVIEADLSEAERAYKRAARALQLNSNIATRRIFTDAAMDMRKLRAELMIALDDLKRKAAHDRPV